MPERACVRNGLDNIGLISGLLKGRRLGLISGGSAVDRQMRLAADVIAEEYDLRVLYNLIHGIRWELRHGHEAPWYSDPVLGIKTWNILRDYVISLTPEMLGEIDIMLFDIREAGARYFEYLYSLSDAMRLCGENHIPFVVLDRPNPLGGERVGGNVCPEDFHTVVGDHGLAVRYGLTVGEYARYINTEYSLGCELTVVPVTGWPRRLYYDETDLLWVLPSPSLPNVDTNLHYVGTCLFEATNLSEGRGTSKPLQMIGAPWLDNDELVRRMRKKGLPGVAYAATCTHPNSGKYAGETCRVIQPHIVDRDSYDPFASALLILDEIRDMHPDQLELRPEKQDTRYRYYLDKLLAEPGYAAGAVTAEEILCRAERELPAYRSRISKYYLYD